MLGAHPPAHLDPVHLGQHQIEQDQVGRAGAHLGQRLRPVADVPGVVTGAIEIAEDHLGQGRVVIDHQNLGHPPIVGSPRAG